MKNNTNNQLVSINALEYAAILINYLAAYHCIINNPSKKTLPGCFPITPPAKPGPARGTKTPLGGAPSAASFAPYLQAIQ
jgi:hypothetical protein